MLSIASYAQNKTVTRDSLSTIQNVERLVDKYGEKIGTVIVALSEKLQQPVEHVYGVLVKQQVVNAIVWLIVLITGIVLFAFAFIIGVSKYANWSDRDFNVVAAVSLITGIASFVMFVLGITHLTEIVQGFINPEYGAIKDIVELVGKI